MYENPFSVNLVPQSDDMVNHKLKGIVMSKFRILVLVTPVIQQLRLRTVKSMWFGLIQITRMAQALILIYFTGGHQN